MPLIEAKCTNCGQIIMADAAKDADICGYCGSAYVVDKAIRNLSAAAFLPNAAGAFSESPSDFEIRDGVLERYTGGATDVAIPVGVLEIGESVFENSNIAMVALPETVVAIRDRAFARCVYLTSVIIPSRVHEIGSSAFAGCIRLEEAILSDQVGQIGYGAFSGCVALREITVPEKTNLSDDAFYGCTGLGRVFLNNPFFFDQQYSAFPFRDCRNLRMMVFSDERVFDYWTKEGGSFGKGGRNRKRLIEAVVPTFRYGANLQAAFWSRLEIRLTQDGMLRRSRLEANRIRLGLCPHCGANTAMNGECRNGCVGI